MKINTNAWNKFRYTLWAPGYDLVGRVFDDSRQRSVESLEIHPGDKVLIIGAGTGLDLPYLPADCEITAIDLTPSMLEKLGKRANSLGLKVEARVMDGQSLSFDPATFDKVILHLILAVIPDPYSCIREAYRVLKPGGEAVVFDKFVPTGKKISWRRRFSNFFANIIASDLTRYLEDILDKSGFRVISDQPAGWKGNFRLVKLVKPQDLD